MSRQLYEELIEYQGNKVFDDVLSKHIKYIKKVLTDYTELKYYDQNLTLPLVLKDKPAESEKSSVLNNAWQSLKGEVKASIDINCHEHTPKEWLIDGLQVLFALSVCNDYLIILLNNKKLTITEYTDFFTKIGMTVSHIHGCYYHPFYHEIFQVVDDVESEDERVTIYSELYPMVIFGDLQFSRAGVKVYAHPTIDKYLAEKSCLYFTNRRENRPCQDLSHGWGHNSRWRTDFVRNYDTDYHWKINVDGKIDLADKQAFDKEIKEYEFSLDFTIEQAKELLFNRHFIHPASIPFTQLSNDIFPYDWRMDVPK